MKIKFEKAYSVAIVFMKDCLDKRTSEHHKFFHEVEIAIYYAIKLLHVNTH